MNHSIVDYLMGIAALTAGSILLIKVLKSNKQETSEDMFQTNKNLPRGYRNNNPLNIIISNSAWQGKVPVTQNSDGHFEQFYEMKYGYRAAMKLLSNYIKMGNNTIEKIIAKWAPASENNTTSYINHVSQMSGIAKDAIISSANYEQMFQLVRAMSIVENGNTPQPDDAAILLGWNLYINS